jgi:tetratricopeptide (TPR) repeat protein
MPSMIPMATALLVIVLTLAGIWSPSDCRAGSGSGIASYDPELYETGYDVFLMNGNVKDALRLAEAALAQRPNDPVWLKRAAQTGEWSGEAEKAVRHWVYLATVMGDEEAYGHAMKLAEGLGDLGARFLLLRHRVQRNGDTVTMQAFVECAEMVGELDEAIAFLENRGNADEREYVLDWLSRLYESNGRPDKAIAAMLEYGKVRPLPAEALRRLAGLQYGMGDFTGAYHALKGGVGTPAEDDPEFLATLGDICWGMQDMECSVQAAERLVKKGKARAADYRRLVFRLRETSPHDAYLTAREACRHFGAPAFFNEVADSGQRTGNWKELDEFLSEIKPSERIRLAATGNYWLFRSKVYEHLGRAEESLSSYREAMRLEPENGNMTAGYLWLLLDLDRYDEVNEFVAGRRENGNEAAEMGDALGAALVYLGNYGKALTFFRERIKSHANDPLWLSAYAEVLEQNGRTEAAFAERMRALLLLRGKMEVGEASPADLRGERIRLAGLMLQLQKGALLDDLMARILADESDPQSRELVTAWALSTERSDLARWWLLRSYARGVGKPRWAQLGLAMEENDRTGMWELLESKPERLPYRDAVEAAARVGAPALGEELAWHQSTRNPDDHLLYNQLREISSGRSSYAKYGLRLLDRGGIGGIENSLSLSAPANQRFTVFTRLSHTANSTIRSGVLDNIPSGDLSATAGLSARFDRGSAAISAGWRFALEEMITLGATVSYRLSSRLEVGGELRYSSPADESVPLAIGGMKDLGGLLLTDRLTGRDTIQAGYSRSYLRDQSRRLLGVGNTYTLDVTHQLRFSYPDIIARGFTGYFDYERKGEPQGRALSLIPEGAPQDSSFFVPESFFQVGAGAGFGQGQRSGYARSWKPFGNLDVTWRSTSGVGFDMGLGMRGPLFGYDSLIFTLSISRGASDTSELSGVVEMGYCYYF